MHVVQVVREMQRCLFCFLQVLFYFWLSYANEVADQNAVCSGRKLKVSNSEQE